MTNKTKITGWLSFLTAVVFKPTWELATTGFFMTLLFVGTWWRDNTASEEWKRRLEITKYLPHWNPAWWLCIGLIIIIMVILKWSHELWLAEHYKVGKLSDTLPDSAPELEFSFDRSQEMGAPLALILHNCAEENLHNLEFQIFVRRAKAVFWLPLKVSMLRGDERVVVRPIVVSTASETQGTRHDGFLALAEGITETSGLADVGEIKIHCSDRGNRRYEVFATIRYAPSDRTFGLSPVSRRLIADY